MKLIVGAALCGLIFATGAEAKKQKRIVTNSGAAEILLKGRTLYAARGQMIQVCRHLNWAPRLADDATGLTCVVPSTEYALRAGPTSTARPSRSGGLPGGYLNGRGALEDIVQNAVPVPVIKLVKFKFRKLDNGVAASATAERQYSAVGGGMVTKPIADQATFLGLMNVIAMAGDVGFVPGTQFGDFGYLGFRSDRFTTLTDQGHNITAIQIGLVEASSPAAVAGLQTGDFILAFNDRQFGDYDEVARYLNKIKPGDTVAMLVERGKDRMTLTATAQTPPASLTE